MAPGERVAGWPAADHPHGPLTPRHPHSACLSSASCLRRPSPRRTRLSRQEREQIQQILRHRQVFFYDREEVMLAQGVAAVLLEYRHQHLSDLVCLSLQLQFFVRTWFVVWMHMVACATHDILECLQRRVEKHNTWIPIGRCSMRASVMSLTASPWALKVL